MRELASTFRIKIQFIEFLCENSHPPSLREGWTRRGFWVLRHMSHKNSMYWIFMRDLADLAPPVVKTGGAQIGDMAEGSQICDFRFAKVGPEGDCESSAARRRAHKSATLWQEVHRSPIARQFNLRLNFNATGGDKFPVLRRTAEGSQIPYRKTIKSLI